MRQQRQLLRLLGPCLAVLLLTLPLWLDAARLAGDIGDGLLPHIALNTDAMGGGSTPADAPATVHCALHCAPQMLFSALLLCAVLLPLIRSSLPVEALFRARLGSAPPLPPPRTH